MKKPGLIIFVSALICLFGVQPAFCQSIKSVIDQADTHVSGKSNQSITPGHNVSALPAASSPDDNHEVKSAKNAATSQTSVSYALQIGTFILENDANAQVIELKKKGIEPYIFQSINSKGRTVFAVRAGNFHSIDNAKKALADLKTKIDFPVFIAKYDSLAPISGSETKIAAASSPGAGTNAEKTKNIAESFAPSAAPEKSINDRLKAMEEEIQQLKDEAAIRKKLSATAKEQEASNASKDILEAAGREYTLTKEGNLRFSYGLSYSYSNYDAIRAASRVEEVANHTISNSFSISYGLKDNFNLSTGIPFVYKYTHVGTVNSKSTTGLGDLHLDWSWQPVKPSDRIPTIIVNGGFGIPSGRSPYDINVDKDLSTGSGIYSTSLGLSVSRVTDPVVVFTSFSASYPFSVTGINQRRTEGILEKVDPGMGLGMACGMGYSLSYRLYLNMSFSYSYSFETTYFYQNAPAARSGTAASARLSLGVGYKYSPRQNLNFSLSIPITSNNGFSFSFSTPIEFEM